jgi:copper chaperone NosL
MRVTADSFWEFLDVPLRCRARLLLVALIVPLLLSFLFPLWRISMEAPQYPQGLRMDIYTYKLVGGNDGHDVQEINGLNHYIGMRQITREELRDLDWMPFGIVAMAMLALRAALLGNVRTIIDLSMVAAFISVTAFGRFACLLWEFGHTLDPKAAVKVEPFMPVVFGSKKIANFMTHSMPHVGSMLMATFILGVFAMTTWYLWRGRRDSRAVIVTAAGAVP